MRKIGSLFVTFVIAGILGCGDDDGTGPGVNFPLLPADLRADACIRGNATKGQTVSGSITDADCATEEYGYGECWRVRVASAGSVTFDANSQFDNRLWLFRFRFDYENNELLESYDGVGNDDRSENNSNALITFTLQPNEDYMIIIHGYDNDETGPYTLQIR